MDFDVTTALNSLETALNWLSVNFPDETALLIMLLVSPVLVPIIKLFHVQNNDVKRVIALSGALLAMGINYLLKDPTVAPQFVLVQGLLLHTFNQPYYKGIVKPLGAKLRATYEQASAINEKKAAVLPTALVTPNASDFAE